MTYTIEDIEGEVGRVLRQLDDCRNNYSPTEFFDDLMARAAGALIHQQEMLRRQHEAIKQLRGALADTAQSIAWSQFGECRGFTESMPLPTITALEKARKALADTEDLK